MTQHSGFGEAEAQRILQRAAEIDAQRPLDLNALRAIASEAGISPASVDRALEEHMQPPRPKVTTRLWQWRGLILATILVVVFVLLRLIMPVG